MSWPLAKLDNHVDILSGFAFKSENFNDRGEGLPLVRIRDVVPGVSDTYYSGEYSSEFLLSDGDLLIGMDGDFNRARWSGGRALLNQRVCKITAKCESLDQGYLYHFLPKALDKIHAETPAVTVKHLSVKGIRAIEIPLPPLPEQKRIAAILDKADTIRRKRQQAIQLADDFLRAVFLDMFGDPVTNPKGWQTFTLAEVVRKDSIITYGIVQAGEHVDGGVPYIRTGDFKGGKLVRSGYACTSSEIASKFKRSEVSPGDIVYCIRASVGSADVVPDFLAGANLTQGTAKISPASDMKSEFLVELLRSAGFRSWIDKNSKGATFKEITLGRLREAPVFKPPLVEQEAFVRIKKIVMDRLAGKFRETDVPLFESLSQKAFCGEL